MNNFNLIKLVKFYFKLPKGYIIDNPNTLNFVCKIFDICDVYISNKALKHIVESRKHKDLMNVLDIVNIIDFISKSIIDPEVIFINKKSSDSIGLSKKIRSFDSLNVIIILEFISKYNHYEVVTVYERSNKKILKLINVKHLIK